MEISPPTTVQPTQQDNAQRVPNASSIRTAQRHYTDGYKLETMTASPVRLLILLLLLGAAVTAAQLSEVHEGGNEQESFQRDEDATDVADDEQARTNHRILVNSVPVQHALEYKGQDAQETDNLQTLERGLQGNYRAFPRYNEYDRDRPDRDRPRYINNSMMMGRPSISSEEDYYYGLGMGGHSSTLKSEGGGNGMGWMMGGVSTLVTKWNQMSM
jgi:hypothetical protein